MFVTLQLKEQWLFKMAKNQLGIIAAVANNRVIGYNGNLPWPRIPEDMKRFVKLTLNHPVIMGRVTFDSIVKRLGHPLERRGSIVVSRAIHTVKQATACESIDAAIRFAFSIDSIAYVIGGQQIYEQTIDKADFLEITAINGDYKGDSFFPEVKARTWGLVSIEKHEGNPAYSFERYERR